MYLMLNFYIFATALFLSLIMVPAIRKWALDSGAVDFPGERRAHNRAIARAGGVAIFVPFLFSILVYFEITREVRGILAGSLLVFFTGLIDDLYQLTPRQKFIGQISGCSVAVLVGRLYLINLGDLFGFGEIILPVWAAGLLSLFALVGVINAINFIDGLDGLAGGISAIALMAFFWLGLQEGNMVVLALTAALLGGLLGFLKYNSFPARIFMGDTGSLVVGFLLGSLAIVLTQKVNGAVNAVVPLMILSVPIVDTLVVMADRVVKGRNPLEADRTHLHHKILNLGLDQPLAVLLIHGLALAWALIALLFRHSKEYWLFFGLLFVYSVTHYLINKLLKHKDYLQSIQSRINFQLFPEKKNKIFNGINHKVNFTIVIFTLIYSALSVFSSGEIGLLWQVKLSGTLGWVGLTLFLYNNKFVNLFCLLMMAPVFLVNYQVEKWGGHHFLGGFSYSQLVNGVFVIIAILIAVKFILQKSLDKVLDFSFEFILFAMGISLAVVSSDLDLAYHLSGVLSRGIVILLSLKFLTLSSPRMALVSSIALNVTFLSIWFCN